MRIRALYRKQDPRYVTMQAVAELHRPVCCLDCHKVMRHTKFAKHKRDPGRCIPIDLRTIYAQLPIIGRPE